MTQDELEALWKRRKPCATLGLRHLFRGPKPIPGQPRRCRRCGAYTERYIARELRRRISRQASSTEAEQRKRAREEERKQKRAAKAERKAKRATPKPRRERKTPPKPGPTQPWNNRRGQVSLPDELYDLLDEFGGGNFSEGVRRLAAEHAGEIRRRLRQAEEDDVVV